MPVLLAIALLIYASMGVGAGRPPKRNGPGSSDKPGKKSKTGAKDGIDDTSNNPIKDEGNERMGTHHLLGLTLTPYHSLNGIEVWDDDERLDFCQALHDRLSVEFTIRFQDDEVSALTLARERGENDNNPHCQCSYEVPNQGDGDEKAEKTIKAEKKWIKQLVTEVTAIFNKRDGIQTPHKPPRIKLLLIKWADRFYHFGYDQKDGKKPWYLFTSLGLSAAYLAGALAYYHSLVFQNTYAGKKADKSPWSDKSKYKWSHGNFHPMAQWFLSHHALGSLKQVVTLAIVVALALSTGAYQLDESVITGKNGGMPLDTARSDALFAIETAGNDLKFGPELVHHVETVLHGAPRTHSGTNGNAGATLLELSMPSTYEIVHGSGAGLYTLDTLKELAATLDHQRLNPVLVAQATRVHERGGRYWVSDFLSFPQSAAAVETFVAAGLRGRECRFTNQVANMCGYLCAGAARLLRAQNTEDFVDLACEDVAALNNPAFATHSNMLLNIAGANAVWLTGDQILGLTSALMAPHTDVGWMHSPSPYNYFETFFARTLAEPKYHGVLHIMPVNTESHFGGVHAPISGTHWFMAAWYLEPDLDD